MKHGMLAGHIPLKRLDRRSQIACLGKCQELLRQGASVLFFPEGTRSPGSRMAAFKKGAFSVAAKAKVSSLFCFLSPVPMLQGLECAAVPLLSSTVWNSLTVAIQKHLLSEC